MAIWHPHDPNQPKLTQVTWTKLKPFDPNKLTEEEAWDLAGYYIQKAKDKTCGQS